MTKPGTWPGLDGVTSEGQIALFATARSRMTPAMAAAQTPAIRLVRPDHTATQQHLLIIGSSQQSITRETIDHRDTCFGAADRAAGFQT
jgi:hypothetical protein